MKKQQQKHLTNPKNAYQLTHWGPVMDICVPTLTIIGSDNGLLPGWRQALIRTNAGILLIWPLGTNFNEMLIEIQTFSLKKIHLKMSSAKCCPFGLGLNVLISTISNNEIGLIFIVYFWYNWPCCPIAPLWKQTSIMPAGVYQNLMIDNRKWNGEITIKCIDMQYKRNINNRLLCTWM